MGYQVAVNGFGRIGRSYLRCLLERELGAGVRVVAVNDVAEWPPGPAPVDATLPDGARGSGHGAQPWEGHHGGAELRAGDQRIRVLREPDPGALPWAELGVDLVVDAATRADRHDDAALHVKAGAGRVLIAGPGAGATDATIVSGVNGKSYDPVSHRVVGAGCPVTACVAPMMKVLNDAFGLLRGHLTVVGADPAAGVGPAVGVGPAGGTAPAAITSSPVAALGPLGAVLPDLAGRLAGVALRVPAGTGSLAELTCELVEPVGRGEVNAAFAAAARFTLPGLLRYGRQPVAAGDIAGEVASCVFDSRLTTADGRLATVFGWYDNGWGFTNRLVDLTELFAGRR